MNKVNEKIGKEYKKFNKSQYFTSEIPKIPFWDEYEKMNKVDRNKKIKLGKKDCENPTQRSAMAFIYLISAGNKDCIIWKPTLSKEGELYEKENDVPSILKKQFLLKKH